MSKSKTKPSIKIILQGPQKIVWFRFGPDHFFVNLDEDFLKKIIENCIVIQQN